MFEAIQLTEWGYVVNPLFVPVHIERMGRDSSVGIATRYGLDGTGIESRWGEMFHTRPDRSWGHPASYTVGTRSFPRVKWPGCGVDYPHASSVEVEERV
jgi:hypothetical protein